MKTIVALAAVILMVGCTGNTPVDRARGDMPYMRSQVTVKGAQQVLHKGMSRAELQDVIGAIPTGGLWRTHYFLADGGLTCVWDERGNLADWSTTEDTSAGCQQEQPPRAVRWSDIPEHVQIVGKLGLPLGRLATVRGVWTAPFPSKPEAPFFMVNRVNGRPLDPPAEFDDVGPVGPALGEGGEFTKRMVGEEWELRGMETGGFAGFGDEVWAETGLPPMQPGPHGFVSFQTRFCYVKAKRVAGSVHTGGEQE